MSQMGNGRTPIIIDRNMVLKMAKIGCTQEEIAAVLDCSVDTLQRRFKKEMQQGWQHRNASIRRKQYQVAMEGHPTMLIWLGKQFLQQRDGPAQQDKDSGNRLDELLNAFKAGPVERGKVNP